MDCPPPNQPYAPLFSPLPKRKSTATMTATRSPSPTRSTSPRRRSSIFLRNSLLFSRRSSRRHSTASQRPLSSISIAEYGQASTVEIIRTPEKPKVVHNRSPRPQQSPGTPGSAAATAITGQASAVEIVRTPGKAKLVHNRSPRPLQSEGGSPATPTVKRSKTGSETSTKQSRKLLEYYGVQQRDQELAAQQRVRRASAFREEFSPPDGVGLGLSEVMPSRMGSVVRQSRVMDVDEGLRKWFRCEIFPTSAQNFHEAEEEARSQVVAGGGMIMEEWTYPGGFMFQSPIHLPSSGPTTSPTGTPLDDYLIVGGPIQVTEFAPYLKPSQHLLQSATTPSPSIATPSTIADTLNNGLTITRSSTPELVSAVEYLRPSLSIEEIPLLRSSPTKLPTSDDSSKLKLQTWLAKQKRVSENKHKRVGVVWEKPGRLQYYWDFEKGVEVLRQIGEMEEELEGKEDDGDGEWDDVGSCDGSEFSIATGLESVRFVAECGSLF